MQWEIAEKESIAEEKLVAQDCLRHRMCLCMSVKQSVFNEMHM